MSIIKPPFEMTGSIRGISFYKQYGTDKVIMRTKGRCPPRHNQKISEICEITFATDRMEGLCGHVGYIMQRDVLCQAFG